MAIEAFGGPERLTARALPRPSPGPGEVLVRVVAAGVNPVDWMIREGRLQAYLPHRFPLVPGWDLAGVVEEFGPGVTRFRKGDRVFGCARRPEVQWGAYAEYVAVAERALAPMPSKLLFEEAAAVPVACLTADQCLAARPGLGTGHSVLIHRAAGGVGHFAVQLAKLTGARVVGTASAAGASFVLGLGADAVVDHAQEDFRDGFHRHCPAGADLILDSVGGDTLGRSHELLRAGGCLVSIAEEPDPAPALARRAGCRYLTVEPDGQRLAELARLFDHRKLRVQVQKIYPLSRAAQAHEDSQAGRVRGKLVLNL